MEINVPIPNWITKLIWFLQDRCEYCGGTKSEHINGKWHCDECGKRE